MRLRGLIGVRWVVSLALTAIALAVGVGYPAPPSDLWAVRLFVGALALAAVLALPFEIIGYASLRGTHKAE